MNAIVKNIQVEKPTINSTLDKLNRECFDYACRLIMPHNPEYEYGLNKYKVEIIDKVNSNTFETFTIEDKAGLKSLSAFIQSVNTSKNLLETHTEYDLCDFYKVEEGFDGFPSAFIFTLYSEDKDKYLDFKVEINNHNVKNWLEDGYVFDDAKPYFTAENNEIIILKDEIFRDVEQLIGNAIDETIVMEAC